MQDASEQSRDLPDLERGKDLSRILAFTDGVFAIAITLLVLQIEVPNDLTSNGDFVDALGDLLPDLFAFGISFAVIGIYWIGHHRLMRMVREYDRGLMWLTLLYLAWIVLLPFSSQLIGEYGNDIRLTATFYIVNLALIAVSQALMVRAILRRGLGEPDHERNLALTLKSCYYTAAVFLVTAPIGLFLGGWTPLLWFPLLAADPWQRKQNRAPEPESRG
ncbi:MAG: TMEM175 family protein [Solirubrobacterales bacterium]|nr:TMEM175 family protein [Solirubrobacterales bacterium]